MRGVALVVGLLVGCNAADPPPALTARIEGQVAFLGVPVGAPARLHQATADGELLGAVAEAVVDDEGRFVFDGLREPGRYAVRVDLEGLAWSAGASGGRFGAEDRLLAPVGELQPLSPERSRREAFVAVSPWTTLLMAVADARRLAGHPRPLASAHEDLRAWFGFDVATTGFGAAGDSLRAEVQHTLLVDGLARLADEIAADVGVRPGTAVDPPALLRALLADVAGEPPAVFDGHGPEGPIALRGVGEYALSAHTLQTDLRAALDALVEDEASPWAALTLADLRPLRERLTCPGIALFPECATEALDPSPPVFVDVKPEPDNAEPLSGTIEVKVRFGDPEGQVVEIALERLRDARGGVVERYAGEDGLFLVDTTTVIGNGTLWLQARARNDSGLWSGPTRFAYAIRNVGEGILGGQVYKGAAAGVTVVAYGARDGVETELAVAITDEAGRFGLRLTEFQGPVRLEARAGPQGRFVDEARGASMRWPQDGTLAALVPDYDPRNGAQSVTISPFSDLALALARVWTRRGDGGLDALYGEALAHLGAHLGLQSDETLVSGVPAPLDRPVARGVEDAERFLLGLACLSEQARALAVEAFPAAPDRFTALDLVALYRQDAADGRLDGLLDGATVSATVDGEVVALPPDALRHDLAVACARWLGGPYNPTSLTAADVVPLLEAMAERADETLFGTLVDPQPFDEAGPVVRVAVEPADEAARVASVGPDAVVAQGRLTVRVTAEDEAGVAAVALTLRDGLDAALTRVEDPPAGAPERRREVTATLDTDALPDRLDGQALRLEIQATDGLGRETRVDFTVHLDRQPPEIALDAPDDVGVLDDQWHTRGVGPLSVRLSARDARPLAVRVDFAGEAVFGADESAEVEVEVPVRAHVREAGRYPLSACATDVLGRTTCAERTVVVDRAPPTATLRPTRAFDERPLPVIFIDGRPVLDYDRAPWVDWDPAVDAPWHLYKAQVTLAPGGDNQPPLTWIVADDEAPMEALVAQTAAGRPLDGVADRQRLRLDAATLGIDPLVDPPEDGAVWVGRVEVRDLAGNVAHLETPPIHLHIVAPPPRVEPSPTPAEAVAVADLALGNAALQRALDGAPIELGAVRITNPWPVPIYLRAPQAPVTLSVEATDGPESPDDHLPERAADYDRVVVPACMLTVDALGRAVPDPTRQVRARARLDGRTLRVEAVAGHGCVERVAVPPVETVEVAPEERNLADWRNWGEVSARVRVSIPASAASLTSLGGLLRARFDQPHSRLLDVSADKVLHYSVPGVACLPATDPWGCRAGWWLTRRVRRVDRLVIGQPAWRLAWSPGSDVRCETCSGNERELMGERAWRIE